MTKNKPEKIKPAEAIKVLANELNGLRGIVQQVMQEQYNIKKNIQDFATVFDSYVNFENNSKEFVAYLDSLLEEKKASQEEKENEPKTDEQADGQNMVADTNNAG